MKRMCWALCVLGALLVACGAAFAVPSQGGPTGIVSLPTAQVAPVDALQGAIAYQSLEVGARTMYDDFGIPVTVPAEDKKMWGVQLLGGVSQGSELWGSYWTVKDGERTHAWAIGAKTQLSASGVSQALGGAVLALGGSYQDWSDVGRIQKLYLTATTDLSTLRRAAAPTRPLLGTLGLIYIKADLDEGGNESAIVPFLGLELPLSEATVLGTEFRFKDSDVDEDPVWSLLVRHQFDASLSGQIALTNANPAGLGTSDQGLFVSLGYNFPG